VIRLHKGFSVQQHQPWKFWISGILFSVLLVIVFYIGEMYQAYELKALKLEQSTLHALIEELETRNQSLVEKNAQLKANSEIEHDAYIKANEGLVQLQRQMLELKKELAFYQGIVSPAKEKIGVNLQSFELTKTNENGQYSYKIVLTKRGNSNKVIKGKVAATILGEMGRKSKKLSLSKIKLNARKSDFQFSFKYFQILQGEILLPENFTPYDVEFLINPSAKKIKSFTETKSWAKALPAGE